MGTMRARSVADVTPPSVLVAVCGGECVVVATGAVSNVECAGGALSGASSGAEPIEEARCAVAPCLLGRRVLRARQPGGDEKLLV